MSMSTSETYSSTEYIGRCFVRYVTVVLCPGSPQFGLLTTMVISSCIHKCDLFEDMLTSLMCNITDCFYNVTLCTQHKFRNRVNGLCSRFLCHRNRSENMFCGYTIYDSRCFCVDYISPLCLLTNNFAFCFLNKICCGATILPMDTSVCIPPGMSFVRVTKGWLGTMA